MSRQWFGRLVAVLALAGAGQAVRAEEGANPVLDKAIKAMGGEEKLGKIKAFQVKGKGTINIMDNESPFTTSVIAQGLDHSRQEFEGEFGGNKIKGVSILAGDKGWRSFAGMTMDLDADALADAKRAQYLQVAPMTLVPLKGKGFKVESAPDEKVGDKNAKALKITGPDSKTFTLYFDEESGLPVKMVAKVRGFMGEEFVQTTTYSDYKDFDGIKKSTKSEAKRDGQKFQDMQLVEFKVLDSVDPKTFAEPKD
jgi:hypothetical protein